MDVEQLGAVGGRVIARLAKHVETAVAEFNLSLAQYRVLGLLAEGTTASSGLAERMAVTRPSVSSLVDGLVARGLVERGADPSDRRRQPLDLTKEGERLLSRANVAVGERLEQILGELDARKASTTQAVFGHLRSALDRDRQRRKAGATAVKG